MKEQAQQRTPAQVRAERRWKATSAPRSIGRVPITATNVIIAITTVVSLLAFIPALSLVGWLAFNPQFVDLSQPALFQPWRAVTVALVHSTTNILHLALNMLSLWMIGRILEPLIGAGRFTALYILGTLGGSVAVTLLAPTQWTVGASGAIFALMGALVVIGRHLGGNITGILIILGVNLAFGIFVGGISWQAHVGGLVAGLIVGGIFAATRQRKQRGIQIASLVALGIALIVVMLIPGILR